MKPVAAPKIDSRRVDDLVAALIQRIPQYWPEWHATIPTDRRDTLALANDPEDFGMALLKLAARMGEVIIEQLNRVPEKNFLAFLDLLGIDLPAPKSARVPLTFSLVEKATDDARVPAGTKVGVANVDDVVFETEEDLLVSRASLLRVYSLNPQQDRYTDVRAVLAGESIDPHAIFLDSHLIPVWPLIEHVLYIGHNSLFDIAATAGQPVVLSIDPGTALESVVPEWEFSTETGWKPLNPRQGATTGTIVFNVPEVAKSTVEGHNTYWIRAKTTQAVSVSLPEISSISATLDITKRALMPDLAFFNNSPIDLTKDFFPFGERPKFNDTFYVSNNDALSKAGATVTIDVQFSDALPKPATTSITLRWEYWDGNNWSPLTLLGDGTNALRTNGSITFTCPAIKPVAVNGKEGYWIRARIVAGDYGKEADYQQTTNDELKAAVTSAKLTADQEQIINRFLTDEGLLNTARYVPATFKPPSLKALTFTYQYKQTIKSGFTILTANNFFYEDVSSKTSFRPFIPADEQFPTLYLGFDTDQMKPVRSTPLSLYFSVSQPRYEQAQNEISGGSTGLPPIVVWRYWDGDEWARLAVEDETHNFSEGGRVRFIAPPELAERTLFGERLFWIKASVESGEYSRPPKLQGVFPNTVSAQHGVTLRDQVLGSSNGSPDQIFFFSKAPVLEGQVIEVAEPVLPSEGEMQMIVSEEGRDAIHTEKDDAGNVTEVWVRWHEVNTFTLSRPTDRHYVVDRLKGRLLFGDGVRGLIPPPGKDNIEARFYRSGGGNIGNCAAGKVTELKTTVPFIDSVTNHEAAAGGSDQGLLDEVMIRGPRQIKNRDRAVTVEDFEWLAYQASDEVAKARCLPITKMGDTGPELNSPGWITLIAVPRGDEDQPLPTVGLIKAVKDYLAERSLATIKDQIDVIGPRYTPISVEASIRPRRIEESKAVEKNVFENLKTFLHPTQGGPNGEGWEFGRDVYISEVASVIQGTEGVDRVKGLTLKVRWEDGGDGQNKSVISIPKNGLPASGRHTITSDGS